MPLSELRKKVGEARSRGRKSYRKIVLVLSLLLVFDLDFIGDISY